MKNKILLVLILCLLFSVPCYAEEISGNDVSFNENISDPRNDSVSGSDIFGVPLLTTTNDDMETIDYTELLEPISDYFSYNISFDSCDYFAPFPIFLSSDHLSIVNSDGTSASLSLIYRLLDMPDFDNLTYYENSSYRYFKCTLDDDDSVYAYIYFNVSDNSFYKATYFCSSFEFNYAPTLDMFDSIENDILDVKDSTNMCMYLVLFLVLERVLYIAWDLFPRKDK